MLVSNVTWKPAPLLALTLLALSCVFFASGGFGFASWWPSEELEGPSKLGQAPLGSLRESDAVPPAAPERSASLGGGQTADAPTAADPAAAPREEQRGPGEVTGVPEGGAAASQYTEAREPLLFSLLMILVSELGDKTFLIAAIMAMTHPPLQIFSAAFSALVVMSVLSAALGHAVPNLIPKVYTIYLAALLFFVFGVKMLKDGLGMDPDEVNHEIEEVQVELADKDVSVRDAAVEDGKAHFLPAGPSPPVQDARSAVERCLGMVFSKTWVTTFVLTFLAEWGDRSQIATIALAAANNMYWVTIGTIVGHSMCTALAVKGGRLLATRISVRTVTIAGAVLFLIFSLAYLYQAWVCNV